MPLQSTRGASSAKGFGFCSGTKKLPVDVEYLVVAGGGSGGNGFNSPDEYYQAGGGGAGGYRAGTLTALALSTNITVTVGAGGK